MPVPLTRRISVDRFLWGGEQGIPGNRYSEITQEHLRTSTLLRDTPHVKLLRDYQRLGEQLFDKEIYTRTPYYQNARRCLRVCGHYVDVRNEDNLIRQIRRFIDHYNGVPGERVAHQTDDAPPLVAKNVFSDYYEVIDGLHRLAIACVRGAEDVECRMRREPSISLVQGHVLLNRLTPYQTVLYQPLDCPELENFTLVRRCDDRFTMMRRYLRSAGMVGAGATYLDLGCSYGYFMAKMKTLGFEPYGVEACPHSIVLGHACHGLLRERFFAMSLEAFFAKADEPYDVVSLLSVLHHFVLGKGQISATDLIEQTDRLTRKVLFVDTGQNHEQWFRQSLPEWDVPYIRRWLRDHSSFKEIIPLGTDVDDVGRYAGNYGRTLFACIKDMRGEVHDPPPPSVP